MSNYWNKLGVPHKGWELVDVYDVKADGQDEDETEYESCMMCNNERIRVWLSHEEVEGLFRVGCNCADKMTGDYVNPKERQKQLEKTSKRREAFVNRSWNVNASGNYYLKIDGHYLLIYKDKKTGKLKGKIDDHIGKRVFETIDEAKTQFFKAVQKLKERGDW